jgi:hypothetical protein
MRNQPALQAAMSLCAIIVMFHGTAEQIHIASF